jgi:hypothetical protein
MTGLQDRSFAEILSAHDAWDLGAVTNSMTFATKTTGAKLPIGLNLEAACLINMRNAGMVCQELDMLTIPSHVRTDFALAEVRAPQPR